jgi:hypothetical protein
MYKKGITQQSDFGEGILLFLANKDLHVYFSHQILRMQFLYGTVKWYLCLRKDSNLAPTEKALGFSFDCLICLDVYKFTWQIGTKGFGISQQHS